jgi:hypothetical protein
MINKMNRTTINAKLFPPDIPNTSSISKSLLIYVEVGLLEMDKRLTIKITFIRKCKSKKKRTLTLLRLASFRAFNYIAAANSSSCLHVDQRSLRQLHHPLRK